MPDEYLDRHRRPPAAALPGGEGLDRHRTNPEHKPDDALDTQMNTNTVAGAVLDVKQNFNATEAIAKGLSEWDDYKGHVVNNQVGRQFPGMKTPLNTEDWTEVLGNTTDDDQLDRMHTFFVTKGKSMDASVLKGDRRKAFMKEARSRFTDFMLATGYAQVADKKEHSEMWQSFLYTEYVRNMQVTPEQWNTSAVIAFDTAVAQKRKQIMDEIGPNGLTAPDDVRAEAGARLLAADRLDKLSPGQKESFVRGAHWESTAEPWNDQEEAIRKSYAENDLSPSKAISDDLNLLHGLRPSNYQRWFGTSPAGRILLNSHEKIMTAMKFKDSGFIDGDIMRRGVYIADPNNPAGLSVVDFTPRDTITSLENKVRLQKIPSEYNQEVPEGTLTAYQRKFGRALGIKKLEERMQADRLERIELSVGLQNRVIQPEEISPTMRANMGPLANTGLIIERSLDHISSTLKGLMDDLNKATIDGPLDTAGKIWLLGTSRNVDMAQNSHGLLESAGNVFNVMTEVARIQDTLLPNTSKTERNNPLSSPLRTIGNFLTLTADISTVEGYYSEKPKVPYPPLPNHGTPGVERPSGVDTDAYKAATPGQRAEYISKTNSAAKMMAMTTEDSDKEQAARMGRLMKFQKGEGGSTIEWAADVFGTIIYGLGTGTRHLAADIIDRPGDIALVWGGNKAGDFVFAGFSKIRKQVFRAHMDLHATKRAMKILTIEAPTELSRVRDDLVQRMIQVDTPEKMWHQLSLARAEVEALLDEMIDAKNKGVITKTDLARPATINRMAHYVAKVFQDIGDFKSSGASTLINVLRPPMRGLDFIWRPIRDEIVQKMGIMPTNRNLIVKEALASAHQQSIMRMSSRLLGDPPDFSLEKARGDLATAELLGDADGVQRANDVISQLIEHPMNEIQGPVNRLWLFKQWEYDVANLKVLQEKLLLAREREAAGTADGVDRDETLVFTPRQIENTTQRIAQTRDSLMEHKDFLTDIDQLQLIVAHDTGKGGYGPWMQFVEKLGDLKLKLFGIKHLDSLKQVTSAADRLMGSWTNWAQDWYLLKRENAMYKGRNRVVYDRAIKLADGVVEAAKMEQLFHESSFQHHVDQYQSRKIPMPSEEQLHKEALDFDGAQAELKQAIAHAERRRDQLKGEYRAMLTLPAGAEWALTPDKILWEHMTPRDVSAVIRSNRELFEFGNQVDITDLRNSDPDAYTGLDVVGTLERLDYTVRLRAAQDEVSLAADRLQLLEDAARSMPEVIDPLGHPVAVDKAHKALTKAEEKLAFTKSTAPPTQSPNDPETDLIKLFHMRPADKILMAQVDKLKKTHNSAREQAFLHYGGDAWNSSVLPGHLKGAALNDTLQTMKFNTHSKGTMMEALADARNHMDEAEGLALDRAMNRAADMEELARGKETPGGKKVDLAALTARIAQKSQKEKNIWDVEDPEYLQKRIAHLRKWAAEYDGTDGRRLDAIVNREAANILEDRLQLLWKQEQANPSGLATPESNVENYMRYEYGEMLELFDAALRSGFIDQALYDTMKRQSYRPHMYAALERQRLVTSKGLERAKQNQAVLHGSKLKGPMDKSEMMFQRSVDKFRVYVREKDGLITDELFTSPTKAAEFVEVKFGKGARQSMEKVGNGEQVGKTTAGAKIIIADPVGKEVAAALGLIEGQLPATRLAAHAKFNRDINIHGWLTAIRGIGGLVLDHDEFALMSLKSGKTRSVLMQSYMRLPPSRQQFGDLAGAYVHRQVVTAMNAASHTFEQLSKWLDSIKEIYVEHDMAVPRILTSHMPSKILGGWNSIVKTNLILTSFKAWVSNVTFNIMANEFTGGRVLDGKNLPNFVEAFRTVSEFGFAPRRLLEGNPTYREAIKHGVLNGSIFDRSNPHLHTALLRAVGMDTLPKVQALLAKQKILIEKRAAAILRGGGPEMEIELNRLMLDEEAIKAALDAHSHKVLKALPKEIYGLFIPGINKLKLPKSELGRVLRESYGMIDDVWRYATYLNLKAEGKTAAEAAWLIKTFMQNYGNLPAGISKLSTSPFGSLVPAFPYELTRLTKNYMRYKPLRLTAMMSIIPALNLVGAVQAGVPLARVFATMRAQGVMDTLGQASYLAGNIMLFNSQTHDLENTINLTNTLFPFADMYKGYGYLSHLADTHFPAEENTVLNTVARASLKFADKFFVNNPAINTFLAPITGRNPATGKPLFSDDTRSLPDVAKAYGTVLARTIVPPWLPVVGGIDMDIADARDAPLHPETGKPYGTEQVGTILSRQKMNIPLKGEVANQFARLFGYEPRGKGVVANDEVIMMSIMYQADRNLNGTDYGKTLETFGFDATFRRFWAQMKSDASTPAEKKAAEDGLRALAAEEKRYLVSGTELRRDPTKREMAEFMMRAQKRGSMAHFSTMDLVQQTITLIEANKAAVSAKTIKNYVAATILTDHYAMQLENDPGQVVYARKLLDEWQKDPRARKELEPFRAWLVKMQRISTGVERAWEARNRRDERLKAEGRMRK